MLVLQIDTTKTICYKNTYIDEYDVLRNTLLEPQTTIESVTNPSSSIITPMGRHLRINGSRSNFEYPHKRRKKYDRTSPQNVAPPGENVDDREPPNSINPLDNDYYSLQIIIPRQLRHIRVCRLRSRGRT